MTSATRRRQKLRLLHPTSDFDSLMQRICFYCRVSTDEQAEQNTVALQLEYLHGRFQADFDGRGPVPMAFAGEFVDEGWSGAIPFEERPGGAQALEAARAGKYDVLALYKVDRLGRKASVLLKAHDDLEVLNVAITSATEPFDTRPGPMQAFGVFVFQLLASIAQLERSTIAARTMGGKLRVAHEGKFVNGAVPFGYKVTPAGLLVPNDTIIPQLGITESELVAQLFERIAGGETTYALGDWLAELGVHSPRRWYSKEHQRLTEDPTSVPWSNRRVWETIRNETYRGERLLNFGLAEHTQDVPPLVTPPLWERANAKMRDRNPWKGGDRDAAYLYLLSRKIHCQCGMLYTGGVSNSVHYYKCNGRKRRHGARCTAFMLRAEKIEAAIWADLAWKIRNPTAALEQAQEKLRARQTTSVDQQARRAAFQKQLNTLEAARLHLRQQRRQGARLDEIEADLSANAEDISAVQAKIAQLDVVLEGTTEMERQYASAVPFLASMSEELDAIEADNDRPKMRAIIDRLVQQVTVSDPHARTPDLTVDYAFAVGGATTRVSPIVNIQTVVVMDLAKRSA